ncbi:cellulose biosynthesis regulator YedQ [Paraburkholderia sp. CNPSo 3274]|uniref:diguanylate cyclase n=1 Tax=Paraburkholderia sp. CNPSo 3274 TaxID=2940932 RepID=UPI0020B790D8|nr:diguanylate cyclase [Paraburkholderia sp. CNPSo 3274]MCP3709552.1 cellulose biosynthesis regulator YedQ [Paraburkholderia sp. CNPSo 3274]
MKRPHLVVTVCFLAAMALVSVVGLRQLYQMTRYDLHSRQRDLEVRAVGVDAMISAERRRLLFLRDYAEHLLASSSQQREGLQNQEVQAALRDSDKLQWEGPGAMGGPPVFGTNAQELAGIEGFHRDAATLPADIVLVRSISPLLAISQHADAVQSTVAYISANGLYVLSPERPDARASDLLRRFSTMPYYRLLVTGQNAGRDIIWTPIYTESKKSEAISTLSAPVYANGRFRGAVVMDVAPSRLLALQLASANLADDEQEPAEFGLLNSNGDLVYCVDGKITAQRPTRFDPYLLDVARSSAAAWMKRDQGYAVRSGQYLLFQHVGETHWILLTHTDDSELTLAAARRVFNSPLIVAWLAIAVLLVGTLFIVKNIFGQYVEASSRLKALARSDPLTGLANRRRFQDVFDETLERAARADGDEAPAPAMAMLMLDIDYFKRVNDRFGHAAGDRVLVIFADILRNNLRSAEMPARVGGEEFAALLPGADLATAAGVAERIRRAVEAHAADSALAAGAPGDAANRDADAIAFTVSIGVAASPADCPAHYEALMSVADRRLYAAKEGGRNRVVAEDSRSIDPARA